jgi:hypothetical protein
MKHRIFVTFASVLAISMLSACGASGPGQTAVEMYEKICKENRFEVMLDYVAPESTALLGIGLQFMKKEGSPAEQALCKEPVKLVSENINGDVAEVVLSSGGEPMHWKKVDGKWKMFIKK